MHREEGGDRLGRTGAVERSATRSQRSAARGTFRFPDDFLIENEFARPRARAYTEAQEDAMTTALRALMAALIASSLLRCGKAPTEPNALAAEPTPVPTPRPTPAPGQLSGDWSGTLKIDDCSENVQVQINDQSGGLDGLFSWPDHCRFAGQQLYFTGTDRGATIDITLFAGDYAVAPEMGGPVSLTSINVKGGNGKVSLSLSR